MSWIDKLKPMSDAEQERSATLEIRFKIAPPNRVEFLQTVESLMKSSTEIPGLSGSTCFEQLGAVNVFLWQECWDSVAGLEGRLETTTIKTLLGAIGVLGELEALEILALRKRSRGDEGAPLSS